jgi:hypothetical protein
MPSDDSAINVTRYQTKVRGMTGIRGENPIPTVHDLIPMVVVENERPEFMWTGQEDIGSADGLSQGAIAAQLGYVGLMNLPGSGLIVVVQAVHNSSTIAASVKVGRGPPPSQTGQSGGMIPLDTRRMVATGQLELATRIVKGGSVPGIPFNVSWLLSTDANNLSVTPAGWVAVLMPDSFLVLEGLVVNTAVSAGFFIRERIQERGLPS